MDKLQEARDLLRIIKGHVPNKIILTIKGQIKAGDLDGAIVGMKRIIRREKIQCSSS